MSEPTAKRALVLSGGGGRGAYHVGALRFLEEHEWFPDVVVGTSIGAVNGAAIVSGHTAHSLWALWKKLRTGDVQRPNLDILIDKSNSLLDTAPLRKTLTKGGWLDLERINAQPPSKHLRITVVEAQTGRLRVFGNSRNPSGKRSEHVPIRVDHIVASCSIPIIYPPTTVEGATFWDGGTVSNTPLGAAIDAGADDIVVVLMTPWEEEAVQPRYAPAGGLEGLLLSAQAAFEWALLASFQADLKLFNRTNRLVQLQAENAALKAAASQVQDGGEQEKAYREIPSPILISPREPIPVADIIRYEPDNHAKLYEMGYLDARSAWARAGRQIE